MTSSKVKKLSVFLADSTLEFTKSVGSEHQGDDLTLSSSVNLCVQFAKLAATQKLPLEAKHILYCCDIFNGGVTLTEFETPDSVSILNALNSMQFSLIDSVHNDYGSELEKWDISDITPLTNLLRSANNNLLVLWPLAMATRQFWNHLPIGDMKPINEFNDWYEWASQWCIDSMPANVLESSD